MRRFENAILFICDSLREDYALASRIPEKLKYYHYFRARSQGITNISVPIILSGLHHNSTMEEITKRPNLPYDVCQPTVLDILSEKGFMAKYVSIDWINDPLDDNYNLGRGWSLNYPTEHTFRNIVKSGQRFFVIFHIWDTHLPWGFQPIDWEARGKESIALKRRRNAIWRMRSILDKNRYMTYYREGIEHFVDHKLLVIMRLLKNNGLLSNTLLTLTADHGEYLMDFDPNKSDKYAVSHDNRDNPTMRNIPLFFHNAYWKTMEGNIYHRQVAELIDIVPTILYALDEDIPSYMKGKVLPLELDGLNISPNPKYVNRNRKSIK